MAVSERFTLFSSVSLILDLTERQIFKLAGIVKYGSHRFKHLRFNLNY